MRFNIAPGEPRGKVEPGSQLAVCYHESGHILAGLHFALPMRYAEVAPDRYQGRVMFTRCKSLQRMTREELFAEMVATISGRFAEARCCGWCQEFSVDGSDLHDLRLAVGAHLKLEQGDPQQLLAHAGRFTDDLLRQHWPKVTRCAEQLSMRQQLDSSVLASFALPIPYAERGIFT